MNDMAYLPMQALLLGQVRLWQKNTEAPSPGFKNAANIIETVAGILPHFDLTPLRQAVAANDARAVATAEKLQLLLIELTDHHLRQSTLQRDARKWKFMGGEAIAAERLAMVTGRRDQLTTALFRKAEAYRGLNASRDAMATYRHLLQIAPAQMTATLSAAHDNLGRILCETGDLDEALRHFAAAEKLETSKRGRRAILANQAMALEMLGEYGSAAKRHEEAAQILAQLNDATEDERAFGYDNDALSLEQLGQTQQALDLTLRAETLFSKNLLKARAENGRLRARLYLTLGDTTRAAEAYGQAVDFARQLACETVDPQAYRNSFVAAMEHRLPMSDKAIQHIVTAPLTLAHGGTLAVERQLAEASDRAGQLGDELTALRAQAQLGAIRFDTGNVPGALQILLEVERAAATRSYALPQAMAMVTLCSLSQTGVENRREPLTTLTLAARLLEVHHEIVAGIALSDTVRIWETTDPGTINNELAQLALAHGAYGLAAQYATKAVAQAEQIGSLFHQANRLFGLHQILTKQGKTADANTVANRLKSLVANPALPPLGRVVAERALANQVAETDPAQARAYLQNAVDAAEQQRARIPPGPARADTSRQFEQIYDEFARYTRRSGDEAGAFAALQRGRGRALLDAAAASGRGDGLPPDLARVRQMLNPGDALVDLAVEANCLVGYVVTKAGLHVVHVQSDLSALEEPVRGDLRQRAASRVALCRDHPALASLVAAIDAALPADARPLLITPRGLHNLPLHTVPLGGQPWCERRAIGYLSCAGALSFPRVAASGAPVFIAGNSRRDLPGAEAECQAIANLYNVRALTGADCTRAALEAALASGPLDIVHLAVHGRGNPLRGGQASLLLADETGDVAWTDLDALTCKPWRVNLVVLSGCSTGLGGLRYGHQLISVAGRILEAGADAVVASLWPVGDDAAHRAMIAFHTALLQARRSGADLRCALDVARATLRDPAAANIHKLRDGRDFAPLEGTDPGSFDPALAAALDWASFFVVGVPRF